MALNARNKGQRGEREIIDTLQPILDRVCLKIGRPPILLQRNQMQSHTGGHDIVGLAWLALEVKRVEILSVEKWWLQARTQGEKANAIPILIYRQNKMKWRVCMYGHLPIPTTPKNVKTVVDISFEAFLLWFEVSCEMVLNSASPT
jgi:hypothetical protein